jgi:hypothetical protein
VGSGLVGEALVMVRERNDGKGKGRRKDVHRRKIEKS